MLPFVVNMASAVETDVAAAEADSTLVMVATKLYLFVCTTDCYITQGTAPIAASAASGSIFVKAGTERLVSGSLGPNLSVVRATADGKAFLAECFLA